MKRPEYSAPPCCSEAGRAASEIHITISPTHRPDYFSAAFGSNILVKSSRQPRCDAARALHRLGYPDDALLVGGSMRGPIGVWRRLRVREDRNGPRFTTYEPFPSARVRQGKAKRVNHPQVKTAPPNQLSSPRGVAVPMDLGSAAAITPEQKGPVHSCEQIEPRRRTRKGRFK
jgi:hypothetical protein